MDNGTTILLMDNGTTILLLQLFVLVVTCIIFAATCIIAYWNYRNQRANANTALYYNIMQNHWQLHEMLIENNYLIKIYDELNKNDKDWLNFTDDEKFVYCILEIYYVLFDRIYILRLKNAIDKSEWQLWDTWLKQLIRHPLFKRVHEDNEGIYHKEFHEYIDRIIVK